MYVSFILTKFYARMVSSKLISVILNIKVFNETYLCIVFDTVRFGTTAYMQCTGQKMRI